MSASTFLQPPPPPSRSITDIFPPNETSLVTQLANVLSTGESGGLFLVTSSTGGGSSTTLAALQSAATNAFPNRLISIVDDMHDLDTLQVAIDAAGAGHLVLASMYASTAAHAPLYLMKMGACPSQLADTVLGVLNQGLVKTLCEHCSTEGQPHGCESCQQSGWLGHAAIGELLPYTTHVGDIVTQAAHDEKAYQQQRVARLRKRGTFKEKQEQIKCSQSHLDTYRSRLSQIEKHVIVPLSLHAAGLILLDRTTSEGVSQTVRAEPVAAALRYLMHRTGP